jgi:hypothetical protein
MEHLAQQQLLVKFVNWLMQRNYCVLSINSGMRFPGLMQNR